MPRRGALLGRLVEQLLRDDRLVGLSVDDFALPGPAEVGRVVDHVPDRRPAGRFGAAALPDPVGEPHPGLAARPALEQLDHDGGRRRIGVSLASPGLGHNRKAPCG